MKDIQQMNDTIQEIKMEIGKIKICRAISTIGTVGFTLATAYFVSDMIQNADIGNVTMSIIGGLATFVQGYAVYGDMQILRDLKLELRSTYLEQQQLERENQPKMVQLKRIK